MAARRPNVGAGLIDLGFAIAAFACGLANLPWLAVVLALAAVATWAWTRRAALARMASAQLAANVALALAVLLAVLGASYWLGTMLMLRGAP